MPTRKQAVLIVHGMGEQVPMQTLRSFVNAVWSSDMDLISTEIPDAETGESPRQKNTVWSKPDPALESFELRRITTERTRNNWRADFYEFYWAHLMQGTQWQHVFPWLFGLLWRNPMTRVPRPVRLAWVLLWIIVLLSAFLAAWVAFPQFKEWVAGWLPVDDGFAEFWGGWIVTAVLLVIFTLMRSILLNRFGDVARYVMATPSNVARRQEIRENGVGLLKRLIDSGEYERIVVAAHSLGTIVALDILNHCFALYNKSFDPEKIGPQPERAKLEQMVRIELGLEEGEGPEDFLAAYQAQQRKAQKELNEQGHPWTVTDFITMGSPLTHSEFLIARDHAELREMQQRRVLPSCPPVLEYDAKTGFRHWTYRSQVVGDVGNRYEAEAPRCPHHSAVFGYTCWTNFYSPHSFVVKGDLISGPVARPFALDRGDKSVSGVRDLPVLNEGLVTHNNYWNCDCRLSTDTGDTPHHVRELRKTLNLNAE
ncbi:hypothetical protein [Poseidonocella sedimentorum]|uniref:Uncharacterized protein n=1 Tax=Poseidonocella sedimentorum TaxID=871652 RepID=A0A1I6D3N2_9RHOB|nr:hypothetical protein [Poseidonocella sedimentorum]SFQ99991.1 hypothetical protein SAMN04515673_10266 [Poseidonocella sedimentorum]